jgi:hypothetical protein
MILYEPALADENHGRTWGTDPVSIRYPSVNTCLTLTLVLPSMLVGAHFGLLNAKGASTSAEDIQQTLKRMAVECPPLEKAKPALLIGNHAIWLKNASAAYQALYNYADGVDADFDPSGWDTEVYKTVDIEIFKQGLVLIRRNDTGQVVVNRQFGGSSGVPAKAKKLLGI